MSSPGEEQTPQVTDEDGWWGQLYDGAGTDTGRTRRADTLDDRFRSATSVTRGAAVPQSVPEPPPATERAQLPEADPERLADLVPDTVLDGATYGAVTLRAASVRGEEHRTAGRPRGDALLTARFGDRPDTGLLLFTVATGDAGTPFGHRAAREVCRTLGAAVGRSHARLAEDIRGERRGALLSGLQRLTDRVYGRLRAQAEAFGVAPERYSAGLRCLLVPADPRCRTRICFGVGEGGLFRLCDGTWDDIDPARAGDAPFRFRAVEALPGDVLVLCSPGFAAPLRDGMESGPAPGVTGAGYGGFARERAEEWSEAASPPGLAPFLTQVGARPEQWPGDRTVAAVWER
ncbi:protein phosphatase 2C domain-containing protein [Streptomyces sp. HNM0574]|uniref:protein phosphatase 2C domain-containing protein n=1 Tax=Streptomyces sp. HNM0574 TaxID=2714954 RepID=UPI00146EFFAE|nr:protein phosphatase 2C domain-containing protein [Streptomyces sp. HNM0574]NLU65903.1 protein phosphatase 2C domain-containing protein [Streptomyces sp. HNM0574]